MKNISEVRYWENETIDSYLDLWIMMIKHERETEVLRRDFKRSSDFNLKDAFGFFDSKSIGHLNKENVSYSF